MAPGPFTGEILVRRDHAAMPEAFIEGIRPSYSNHDVRGSTDQLFLVRLVTALNHADPERPSRTPNNHLGDVCEK